MSGLNLKALDDLYIDDEGDDDIQLADEASGLGPLKPGKREISMSRTLLPFFSFVLLFQREQQRSAFCLCDSFLLKLSLMVYCFSPRGGRRRRRGGGGRRGRSG